MNLGIILPIVFFNIKFKYNKMTGFNSFLLMFIFLMLLISTHSCALGTSCTYQIQISWKLASPHLLSPKRKGCFEFSVSSCGSPTFHLPQPHNCFPSVLLKLGRGSGFEACAKELGFQGKTLKWGKRKKREHLQIPFLLPPVWLHLQTEGRRM